MKKNIQFKKYWISLTIIIFLLVLIRLTLPYLLLHYVNKQINKIPDYKAHIADLDLHLYRGSYTIKDIQLWKINKKAPVPFFSADSIDLAVQWKPLFHGKFVAKIWVEHPALNFVVDPKGNNDQVSINKIWIDIAKSLFPLNFNEINVDNGLLTFRSLSGGTAFNLRLKNINIHIHNIQNADKLSILLPSLFDAEANPEGPGEVRLKGKFNPFKKSPTFYLNGYLKNVNVQILKNFLMYYTGVNATQGNFSLYTEMTAADGKIEGYAKPFVNNLKIAPPPKASPLKKIYNNLAAVVAKVIENPQKKTIATQINFQGSINDPDTSILSIIFYALRHAFIQAIIPQIDHSIKIENLFTQNKIKYS